MVNMGLMGVESAFGTRFYRKGRRVLRKGRKGWSEKLAYKVRKGWTERFVDRYM